MVYLFALLFAIFIVLLLFGLMNPRWVVFQRTKTRGRALLIYGTSALASFFLFGLTAPQIPSQSISSGEDKQTSTEQATPVAAVPTDSSAVSTSPPLSPTSVSEPPSEVIPKASPKISTIAPEVKPEVAKPQPVEKSESEKAVPKPDLKVVERSPQPDHVKPKPEPESEQVKPKTEPVKVALASDTPIRSPKHGNCDCPFDRDSIGHLCGKRSAFSRPKGERPVCYR